MKRVDPERGSPGKKWQGATRAFGILLIGTLWSACAGSSNEAPPSAPTLEVEERTEAEAARPQMAAQVAAEEWLEYVDEGEYLRSWDEAAEFLREATSPEQWESSVRRVREPLGEVIQRDLRRADHPAELPNAPEGEYAVLIFETTFEAGVHIEEAILHLEADGAWRPVGYLVRPDIP